MSKGPYQAFANRLIQTLKDKGHTASRSPKGICIRTLAEFTGASEQICRRYIRGDALPDFEKVSKIANQLEIKPGWLLFGDEETPVSKETVLDDILLHYLLKQSHRLYQNTPVSDNDYADFVLGLIKEVRSIDTPKENLIKIIDLAIGSISSYEKNRHRHDQFV